MLILASVALSMRRPNMLRYNRNISDSINFLTTCSRAVPSDERLIAWAKLLIITEEIGISFSLDDLGRVVSLAESRAQLMLKSFEKQLAGWYNETHSSVMNGIVRLFIRNTGPALKLLAGSLRMMYHNANIYLHEIALHADHCPEDFKLPLGRASKASIHKKISPPYIDAITICISSAHSLLDAFLAIDLESSQALPVFNHVRVSYAVFVLTKLYISASDPKSDLCSVLDRGNLRVDSYTDLVIARLESIAKRTSYVFPKMFVGPLYRLREWIAELETAPQWQDQMQRIGEPLHFRAGRKEHEPSNHKEDGNGSLESPKSDSVVGTVSMSSFEWDLPEMNPHSIPDCWRSDPNAQNFSLSSSDQHMDVDPATEPSDSAILIDTIRQPEFGHDSNTFNGFQMDLDSEIFSMFDAMGGIRGDTIDWSSVPSIEFQSTGMELPWTLDSSAQDNSPLNP